MNNYPGLWQGCLPSLDPEGHKYDRGVAAIFGAPDLTGATRLAAAACARIGAGLVNVLSVPEAYNIYRATLPAHILVRPLEWNDPRITARLYGVGGLGKGVRIRLDRSCVLDADALLRRPENLSEQVVLTPHEGEFEKMFPGYEGERKNRALAAAENTGAVMVLKGAQTVIAHPDGRIVLNDHASSYLATAGTGDVLAGMITGLLAQGMPAFEAACAAVWMHGDAAMRFGPGLVAADLPDLLPGVLKELLGKS